MIHFWHYIFNFAVATCTHANTKLTPKFHRMLGSHGAHFTGQQNNLNAKSKNLVDQLGIQHNSNPNKKKRKIEIKDTLPVGSQESGLTLMSPSLHFTSFSTHPWHPAQLLLAFFYLTQKCGRRADGIGHERWADSIGW